MLFSNPNITRTLLAGCVLCIAAVASATELHLRKEALPLGALITLGDVAQILTNDAALAEHLTKTELFPAPPSGSSRLVRASEVRDTLAQRGLDLRQIRFVGASSIWVHGGQRDKAPVEKVAQPAVVPAVAYAAPSVVTTVVVALRPLQRGVVVRASDVQLQSRPGEAAPGTSMSVEEVIGRQVVRTITAGAAIPLADLQVPQLIEKNDVVTVYARTRGMQVRTSAKALEPGAKGDIIALESLLDRNAHFTARVVGMKEVEILAGAPLVTSPATNSRRSYATETPPRHPRSSVFGLRVRDTDGAFDRR